MDSRLFVAAVLTSVFFGSGCGYRGGGGGGDDDDGARRPAEAPDFVVVGVSGHCFGFSCPSEDYSPEYLEAGGSLEAIATAIAADGGSVTFEAYGDSFWSYPAEDGWTPGVRGFLELVEDLNWIYDNWMAGFENPTIPIVVAHSHGTVWAHTALHLLDYVPVLLLVDLDGESLGWESDTWTLDTIGDDWAFVAEDFYYENVDDWPLSVDWHFDIWDAANAWDIPGVAGLQDIEDVVPWNVGVNIETASTDSVIQDGEPNHRLDGSQDHIYRFEAVYDGHGEVDDLGSETMDWLLEVLDEIAWDEVIESFEDQ